MTLWCKKVEVNGPAGAKALRQMLPVVQGRASGLRSWRWAGVAGNERVRAGLSSLRPGAR